MTDPQDRLSEDDIALAGEYVLGTLPLAERQDATRRILRDPEFAREVARWEARLDPLADEVRPVAPPARVWSDVESRVFGTKRRTTAIWGWLVGAGGLAAAALVALLYLAQPAPPPGPMYISDMVSQNGKVRLAALYDAKNGEMRVSMGGDSPQQGRDFELWLINGDKAPISLGVMPHEGKAEMPIPQDLRPLMADATLAITDEPAGGSPTGVATGPLVAAAPLRRI